MIGAILRKWLCVSYLKNRKSVFAGLCGETREILLSAIVNPFEMDHLKVRHHRFGSDHSTMKRLLIVFGCQSLTVTSRHFYPNYNRLIWDCQYNMVSGASEYRVS